MVNDQVIQQKAEIIGHDHELGVVALFGVVALWAVVAGKTALQAEFQEGAGPSLLRNIFSMPYGRRGSFRNAGILQEGGQGVHAILHLCQLAMRDAAVDPVLFLFPWLRFAGGRFSAD